MSKEKLVEVTDGNWDEEIIRSDKPVVVDFWAEWCMPCRIIEPMLKELASKYEGKIKFARLNVDENPEMTEKYGIMAIPTLIIFNKGEEVDRLVGAVPKEKLEKFIKDSIKLS